MLPLNTTHFSTLCSGKRTVHPIQPRWAFLRPCMLYDCGAERMAAFMASAMYLTLPGLTPAMENLPFVVGQRCNISRCHPARATSSADVKTKSKDLPFLVQ